MLTPGRERAEAGGADRLTDFIESDTPPDWKAKQPKRRWSITWTPQDEADRVRYFAGIWDRWEPPGQEPVESFAFVTGPPGQAFSAPQPDTGKPLHARQAGVLTFDQGMEWLQLDGPGKAILSDPEPIGGFVLTPRPRELETGSVSGNGLALDAFRTPL